MTTSPFELWLYANHYRPSTLRATVRNVEHARKRFDATGDLQIRDSNADALRRYASYLSRTEGDRDAFDAAVAGAALAPITRYKQPPKGPRKRGAAVSFQDADWDRLFEAVSLADTPESYVLHVQFITSYRISDVLGIRRDALKTALRSGVLQVVVKGGRTKEVPVEGARDVWEGIYEAWPVQHETLAHWVCPRGTEAGGGAYQRVNRYFKALAQTHGVDTRVYLHRIRRTVGVRALRATRDIHVVSQLMGHATIASTQTYTDELRAGDIAALQQSLRKKHAQEE